MTDLQATPVGDLNEKLDENPVQEDQYRMIWIGTGIAVFGNFLSSLSFQLQRLAHQRNTKGLPYTSIPLWWAGFALMALGEVGNFLAYGMAPASLVSPLGAVAVISNAVLSRIVLKEPLSWRRLIGVILALLGSVLIALAAPAPKEGATEEADELGQRQAADAIYDSLITWRAFGYLAGILAAFFVIANPKEFPFFLPQKARQEKVIWNTILCGLMGAITVMSSKGVSTALNQGFAGNPDMFARGDICWLTYCLIICAVGSIVMQLKYLNEALMHFGSSVVVPVYYVVFTSITISAGMVLFLEIEFSPLAVGVSVFVFGIFLAFFGVFLINEPEPKTEGHEADADAEAAEVASRKASVTGESPLAITNATRRVSEAGFPPTRDTKFGRVESIGMGGLKTLFNDADKNNNGELNRQELEVLALDLDQEDPAAFATRCLEYMDKDHNDSISFQELSQWYYSEDELPEQELDFRHKLKRQLRIHHAVLALRVKKHMQVLAVTAASGGAQLGTLFKMYSQPATAQELREALADMEGRGEDISGLKEVVDASAVRKTAASAPPAANKAEPTRQARAAAAQQKLTQMQQLLQPMPPTPPQMFAPMFPQPLMPQQPMLMHNPHPMMMVGGPASVVFGQPGMPGMMPY